MNKLTQENYYSDNERMSFSKFKEYLECPAKAQAIAQSHWTDERDETPLLVGNYIHSHFESEEAHAAFLTENGDKMIAKTGKTSGQLKANYKQADDMIARLERHEVFKELYQGEKEHIVEGILFDTHFKGKIDCLNVEQGYLADIKTVAKLDKFWNNSEKKWENFIINRKYHVQMAIYAALLEREFGKKFKVYICAVTKDKQPKARVYEIPDEVLAQGYEFLEENLPDVEMMLAGLIDFTRCEKCDWCEQTNEDNEVQTWEQLQVESGIW
jgi:GTPase SAR1 family protein